MVPCLPTWRQCVVVRVAIFIPLEVVERLRSRGWGHWTNGNRSFQMNRVARSAWRGAGAEKRGGVQTGPADFLIVQPQPGTLHSMVTFGLLEPGVSSSGNVRFAMSFIGWLSWLSLVATLADSPEADGRTASHLR